MPGRKGSKKRKQTTCGGASSPRSSSVRSASPRRSRSRSSSPKRSRSVSNNINHINRSPDYDAPYSYDAIYDILMKFKTNRPSTQETEDLTRALRQHINKENLDAFLESIKSESEFKIKKIHKLVYIPFIEKRINDDKELSRKEKKEKIKLFRDLKPQILRLEYNAFSRKGPPKLVEATSIAESLAALKNYRRIW